LQISSLSVIIASMVLHPLQEKLLNLANREDLGKLSLRDIGVRVGIGRNKPQLVKYHLEQLRNRGLIRMDKMRKVLEPTNPGWAKSALRLPQPRMYKIPIYGMAMCGPEGIAAEQNLQGYLTVSNALLRRKPSDSFFAVQARGYSMNRANVAGKNIEEGDYLVVDSELTDPDPNKVVVAIIDNSAVVKRFVEDTKNEQIALVSDSTQHFPPIYLHPEDDFFINGTVVQVIKQPKLE